MSPLAHSDDLDARDLADLADADALTAFFERLAYLPERLEQVPENLGVHAESVRRPIRRVERIARQGDAVLPFEVYLFELTKLTLTHTRALVKAFRDRAGNFLLVLTHDWERLDFVYVERQAPDVPETSTGMRGPERVRVRPRILTVERRNPTRVALRVLRRLRWTSEDSLEQGDKVLSAYSVADWSEELFNNRALFSDYFLNERLPQDKAWSEDPKPVMRQLRRAYEDADLFADLEVADLRRRLLGPVLRSLGFHLTPDGGQDPPAPRRKTDSHRLEGFPLYAPDGTRVAALFDCRWGRYLDGQDEKDSEDPTDNPGVRVVQAFEEGEDAVDWAILTNGCLFRLYGRRAHSRATNFYEIDLTELLSPGNAEEALDAFRYFWLFFRCESLVPKPTLREGREVQASLVDRVHFLSEEYAKGLGERLKETVFEEVFPELAQGFLRSPDRERELFSQDELDTAFRGTLAFLYRTLFLLYAEARDLLPVHEIRDYLEISLKKIREEVASAGGAALSSRDQKLAKHYRKDSYALYEHLRKLFQVIDLGEPAVNVPTYNGGLFLSDPAEDDLTAEAEAARFLLDHRVDDHTLALALDRLARAEEEKQARLVPIDYRSLGVRQLGSIYEGLLEFRLRVAHETMAVVAEKKGSGKAIQRVVPLEKARESKKWKILTTGRAKNATERILPTGTVYLENDKGERRLTGSYYTPDFIVEYLVARTLGPILEEKLDALRPRIRQAQKWQRNMSKMAAGKGESPEKYRAGPAVDGEWGELVEVFFDVKVLDPAMGSGHFLVEAVDFITDRMLEFLGAFPWNPVFAYLESTRREITSEMEKLEILIPEERLTDVKLLKRHVLKRCIYGVDLNPMAVELAKVSLWLDCFTLGAPLSFLDHHLRCGNSLLGVTIDEVREVIEGKAGENSAQLGLFTSRFEHLKKAAKAMADVGAMPDVTTEQIRRSRTAYRSATSAMAQYHRMLDVWCSRWFVKPPTQARAAKPSAVKKKKISDAEQVRQYLRSKDLEAYFAAPNDEAATQELRKMEEIDREYLGKVVSEAESRRFFHWEIEFPEVFYKLRPGTLQSMERAHGKEFDAVVGNPPWVRQESLKELKPTFKDIFPETYAAEADIYVYIVSRSLDVLARGGRFGMILQNKWLRTEYAGGFREFLRERMQPEEVIDFGHAPLFPDADTFPCTLLIVKPANLISGYTSVNFVEVDRVDLPGIDLMRYRVESQAAVPRQRLHRRGWELLPQSVGDLMEKIRDSGTELIDFIGSSPFYGIKTGFNQAFLIDHDTRNELVDKDPNSAHIIKKLLRGEDVTRWHSTWSGEWMIFSRRGIEIDAYPAVKRHLEKYRQSLEPRPADWRYSSDGEWTGRKPGTYKWYELQDTVDYYREFDKPKIVYQDIAFHSSFSVDRSNLYPNNTCYIIPASDYSLLATLNSSVAWLYFANTMQKAKDGAFRMHSIYVEKFPVPSGDQDTHRQIAARVQLVMRISESFQKMERSFGEAANVVGRRSKNAHAWKLGEEDFQQLFKRNQRIEELRESRKNLRAARLEICHLEVELQQLVFALYDLTPKEVHILRKTAPPRDPLTLVEEDLRLLSDD